MISPFFIFVFMKGFIFYTPIITVRIKYVLKLFFVVIYYQKRIKNYVLAINEYFTMRYSSKLEFRAGIASLFSFYDLDMEKIYQ